MLVQPRIERLDMIGDFIPVERRELFDIHPRELQGKSQLGCKGQAIPKTLAKHLIEIQAACLKQPLPL